MASSTAATALLILTILIASEVSSAPREEIILQESKPETFQETREAEVLERHSIGNEKFGESKEDEVLQRRARAKEPLPSKDESKAVSTKKPITPETQNETSEAKDMTESFAPPQPDDDSANSNKTLPNATDNNNKESATVDVSANNKSTDNTTVSKENLPPMIFPTAGVRKTSEEEVQKLSHNNQTNAATDATAKKSNDTESASAADKVTTTTIVSPESTTVSSATIVTTEKSSPTTATPTTQTTASTITTSPSPTTAKAVITTSVKSPNSEMTTESPMTVTSTEPSKAELQLHAKKIVPMPSGIVALITAIAFAIVAVMAYVGLVVWRRYLEWRYGNRELLVNDFDANDIGNFEL